MPTLWIRRCMTCRDPEPGLPAWLLEPHAYRSSVTRDSWCPGPKIAHRSRSDASVSEPPKRS